MQNTPVHVLIFAYFIESLISLFFRENFPGMIVYNQDINVILRWIIKVSLGHHVDAPLSIDEQPLPPPFNPKEIDIVIAGFPWQVL
jgi:hypothetical protein